LGGPTIEGGTAFVGSTAGAILAFDALSGRRLWRVPTDGQVNSAPAVSDGRVFAVSENRRNGNATLYAVRADGCGSPTCKPLWTFSPPGQAFGSSSPAVAGSTVYVAFGDAALRAIDASTGRVRWSGRVRGPLFSPRTAPAVAGASVYVLDAFSGLFRLDGRTGRRVWDYQFAPSATSSAPIVALGRPSTVYVGLDDGTIAGIDAGSGHIRWKSSLGSGPAGPLAVGAAGGRPALLASSEAARGGISAFVPDPSGRLLDIESPTILKYVPALRNFAIAFVALMGVLLALFRFLLSRRASDAAPAEEVE
jgi:outer membrane protein assembly factor BamB